MIGLDTNVLMRFLLQDDDDQAAVATAFMESLSAERPGFVSLIVLAELHWTIRGHQRGGRAVADDVVTLLLDAVQIEIEDDESVQRALTAAGRRRGQFTDALIADAADLYGCESIVTFDRTAADRLDFTLLA